VVQQAAVLLAPAVQRLGPAVQLRRHPALELQRHPALELHRHPALEQPRTLALVVPLRSPVVDLPLRSPVVDLPLHSPVVDLLLRSLAVDSPLRSPALGLPHLLAGRHCRPARIPVLLAARTLVAVLVAAPTACPASPALDRETLTLTSTFPSGRLPPPATPCKMCCNYPH
jgi:hypothetical protein